jgi:hypothetical protein
MTNAAAPKTSPAFMLQSGLAFAIALVGMVIGESMLPISPWTRAFLAMGTVFLVSSAFTLAKVVRDQHETGNVVNRIDQARLDRLLAEFDPYHVPTLPQQSSTQPANVHPTNSYPTNPQPVLHFTNNAPMPPMAPYPGATRV